MSTTATDLKYRLGQYLDEARRAPVEIEKNGRKVAVLISWDDYEHLTAVEDAYWAARVRQSEAGGYAGTDAGERLLRSALSDEDGNAEARSGARRRKIS